MKGLKKLLTGILTATMLLSMGLPVSATEPTTVRGDNTTPYTITINNPAMDHTYTAYQIFKGTLDTTKDSNNKVLSQILSDIEWGSGVSTATSTVENAEVVANTIKQDTDAKVFADSFNGTSATRKLGSPAGDTKKITDSSKPGEISVTGAGYYLITDTSDDTTDVVSRYMLAVVGDTSITTKSSDIPKFEKKVYENSTEAATDGAWQDSADYQMGDTVKFKLTATMPDNYANYKEYYLEFQDDMDPGLTLNKNSIVVNGYIGTSTSPTIINASQYSLTTKSEDKSDHTFDIVFTNLKPRTYTKVEVEFNAQLNQNAQVGSAVGNVNSSSLVFSNDFDSNNHGNSEPDYVIVFTYRLNGTKIDKDVPETKLPDAEFVLQNNDKTKYAVLDSDHKVTGWVDNITNATKVISDKNGLFNITGLDRGQYYLQETKAPSGYNLRKDPVSICIESTLSEVWKDRIPTNALTALNITVDNEKTVDGDMSTGLLQAIIRNGHGTTLPSTGGIGTTIFYLIGGIMILGAFVSFIVKRKMAANK